MKYESMLKNMGKKIEKLTLDIFLFNLFYLILAIALKSFKNDKKIVGFSGNYLNGEIKYIFDEMKLHKNIRLFFVTDLNEEIVRLEKDSIDAYYCRDIRKIPLFIDTKVWVTSHGPYCIPDYYINKFFKKHSGKWVDTWHGVGVEEGSGVGRAKMLLSYDLAFIPSEFYRDYYNSKHDGLNEKLKVTGSPRTDPLIRGDLSREDAVKNLELPQDRTNILYAPSWGNPAVGEKKDKSLFPYGKDSEMINELNRVCVKNECNVIIRPHPDWEIHNQNYAIGIIQNIQATDRIFYRPLKRYPLTEPVLCSTDILITDYSSVANDFIVLNRPIIYLDKGLPEDRFIFKLSERGGFVVKNAKEMVAVLQSILSHPERCMEDVREKREMYRRTIYKYVDGRASERCAEEIMRLMQ